MVIVVIRERVSRTGAVIAQLRAHAVREAVHARAVWRFASETIELRDPRGADSVLL